MSSILYYSNFCNNSKNLLILLSKTSLKDNIHFICIDKRIQKNNNTYVILENNQEILLPSNVKAVPALLLLNQNYKVLLGSDILDFLKPVETQINNKSTEFNGEPSAYSINNPISGIISDNYSYLDQNSEELSAKGNGGMRQLYNYATIDYVDKIETPPDDYVPDKIGEVNIKNLEQERNIN